MNLLQYTVGYISVMHADFYNFLFFQMNAHCGKKFLISSPQIQQSFPRSNVHR